jgi:iron complex transport system substrate-binding protein
VSDASTRFEFRPESSDMPARLTVEILNSGAVLLALVASGAAALHGAEPIATRGTSPGAALPSMQIPVPYGTNGRALPDATGTLIPLFRYRRIASASSLADPLLLALAAPEDVIAFSARADDARDAYRYSGKPHVDATHRSEALLTLAPDLVLLNSLGDFAAVQRLREAGLTVFDLGPMHGLQTFLGNVSTLGWLLGRPDSAQEFAEHFQLRLEAVASAVPAAARRQGLYLGIHGSSLYGGTLGSSYHDVLTYAGLDDVAAHDFTGWPSYDPEQLLSLDPEVIVTQTGMRAVLCQRAEFERLRACGVRGQVIEIEPRLLNDAGLGMLDASELIHRAAYPSPGSP